MNKSTRSVTAIALVALLAACAPAADEGGSFSTDPTVTASMTEQPMASTSMAPGPSDEAAASHDMGDMGGSAPTTTVEIVNFAYAQPDLTVSAGTEVTFTNLDSAPHTVTAGTDAEPMPDLIDSGLLQPGEQFTLVFEEPGEYRYFCDRHPPMEGTVTVTS
jgi:plastocyanin